MWAEKPCLLPQSDITLPHYFSADADIFFSSFLFPNSQIKHHFRSQIYSKIEHFEYIYYIDTGYVIYSLWESLAEVEPRPIRCSRSDIYPRTSLQVNKVVGSGFYPVTVNTLHLWRLCPTIKEALGPGNLERVPFTHRQELCSCQQVACSWLSEVGQLQLSTSVLDY